MYRVHFVDKSGVMGHADFPDMGRANAYAKCYKVAQVSLQPDPARLTPCNFMRAEDMASGKAYRRRANMITINLDDE